MSHLVVKVKRESIAACMTCPICNKLFRDATTISECLHTFCRKCIYKKLSDEEVESCPICNIDLGCVPFEKLRPDHNLQDVRAKIFPYKRRKVEAPEVAPSIALPVKRKERSLSSLVVSTPRVSTQAGMTGRRSKSARKALRNSSFSLEKTVKKEEASAEDRPKHSSSPETLNKFTQSIRQSSSTAEPSSRLTPDKEAQNGTEQWEGKVDLWKPLTCLVEAANRSKSSRITSPGSAAKLEPLHFPDTDGHVRKSKVKEDGQKLKVQDEKNSHNPAPLETEKPKKLRKIRHKKAPAFGDFNISPRAVLDAASAKSDRGIDPVWFSLVASEDQEGDAPLPQISASYLRIKRKTLTSSEKENFSHNLQHLCSREDGNIPVSFIQKYLVRKLDLRSEDEVEIRCMGRSILPTWQLNHLVDLWLQSITSERVSAAIGSSAKDFVMVLAYARKAPAP